MKKHLVPVLIAGFGIILLNGCMSVGPDYEVPETTVPDAWHEAVLEEVESGEPNLKTWWTVFGDEMLNDLITKASTNNFDLKTASARIEQAAALRGVSASQYWPDIVAGGAASAIKTTPAQGDYEGGAYGANLSMAWELDLWGRVRRSVESADATLQASVENYRDIMVVLYADIARSYIDVRTLQARITFAENNLKAQLETMELTQNRFNSGLVPALDVSQSRLNSSRTESAIPPLRQSLIESINRLSVLSGDMPYALLSELNTHKAIPACTGAQIAIGLPANLLRQRPDIRRAERELAAQNAKIGATQADLYPTLTLPGTLAIQSLGSGNGDVTYGFGPQLRWNIFNGKRIRSQIAAEEAGTKAALYFYEQTVLLALEEVEGSMAAYANETLRVKMLETAAAAAEKSVNLVTELYKSGLTDFQNVLNMEQALLVQQDALATSQGLISLDLVGIYKSLGGGWAPPAEAPVE